MQEEKQGKVLRNTNESTLQPPQHALAKFVMHDEIRANKMFEWSHTGYAIALEDGMVIAGRVRWPRVAELQ